MNRLDRFVNLLFLLASLCNTLFCVHRFARRRTIAKRPQAWQDLFSAPLPAPSNPYFLQTVAWAWHIAAITVTVAPSQNSLHLHRTQE